MKVKELFEPYLAHIARKQAPKTVKEHTRMLYGSLSHSISEREISSLVPNDASLVIEAGKAHGRFGPQRSIVVLRQLLRYLHGEGKPTPFDWRDVPVPHVTRKAIEYLTPPEVEKLLESIDVSTLAGLRTRALVELLFATGMRIGEACNIDKDHVDWEKRSITITNSKTKDIEKVEFTERSAEWVQRYLAARKDDLPFLFMSGRGRLLPVSSRNYLATHLKDVVARQRIYHHLFRKSFATSLVRSGMDIAHVKKACRHKSSRTTIDFYLGVNDEQFKDEYHKIMENVFKKEPPKPKAPSDALPEPKKVTMSEFLQSR